MRPPSRTSPAKASRPKKPKQKAEVGSTRRLRKSYVIHFFAVAALSVIVLSALSVTVVFNAEEVIVKGESVYSHEEILNAGGIEIGQNLIRFDSAQAQEDIMDKLVCLDGAQVKKVFGFPSSIEVTVENAERIFSIQDEKNYFDISRRGRVINEHTKPPKALIITGVNLKTAFNDVEWKTGDFLHDDEERVLLAFEITELVERYGLHKINNIDITDKFDINLFYDKDRIEVKFGSALQLEDKFKVAAKIIKDEIDDNEEGVLRISNPRKASFKPNVNP